MNISIPSAACSTLLVIEDSPALQMLYRMVLEKAGFKVVSATSAKESLVKFEQHGPAVVLLDLMLPDMDGMRLLQHILDIDPRTQIIVITADGSVDKAVAATRKGAHDFLVKPLGDMRLVTSVSAAIKAYRAKLAAGIASGRDLLSFSPQIYLGKSPATLPLREQISALARSRAPVFILGEGGTGKAIVARIIHDLSDCSHKPFVSLDCAMHHEECLGALLFGPTSNVAGHGSEPQSAFIKANGGTLLIENPQSLPLDLQERLLKTLQRGQVIERDGTPGGRFDIRLICSARDHPAEAVRAGLFNEDLYFQLCVIPLQVPPLRARKADIGAIAKHLTKIIAEQEGKNFRSVAEDAVALLQSLPWKGNLQEMSNMLRHAIVMHDGLELTAAMLPDDSSAHCINDDAHLADGETSKDITKDLSGMTMAEIERHAAMAAIARHGGSISRAARELDIAPSTLYRKRDVWLKDDA